jgi:endo-1,4-beta-xylanase
MKRVFLNILVIVLLISNVSPAVAASGRNVIGSPVPQLQAASSIVVSSVNFDDSTTGAWTQSGSPTLAYVDDGSGGQALSITRAADYEGIQSPTGLLEADVVYTFSMRARLPADSAVTSTDIRFVVKPNYNWVGNTTINATDWTTVTGTYTLPAGVDPAAAQIYIGSTDQTGPYTILIDDILITRPAAVVTISSVDFNDSTTGTWTQSGGPTLAYVDDGSGGQALSITRAADYEGIQSPTGLLEADVVYTFSMRARLPADSTVTSTDVRFVVKPNYNWVGNTTINATDWTTITGTYTLPAGVDLAAVQVYIGSTDQTGPYTVLIDDILITRPDSGGGTGATVIDTDFENGLDGWVPRNAQGTPTVELTTEQSHSPTHAALVSNRTGQGDGIGRDVTGLMEPGTTYIITAWVRMATGTDSIWLSMQRTNAGADSFDTLGQFDNITADAWEQVTATYQMGPADSAFLYFETSYSSGTNTPFLVDDITVQEQGGVDWDETLTPLKDTVDFPVGVAIDSRETTGAYAGLLQHHFEQITPENHMKPEAWYDADRNFRIHPEAQLLMDFAAANGIRVYGHTLLWHQQTPEWFFQRDDGTPLTNSPEDQAILSARLHDHIFNVAQTLSDMYGPFGSATNPLVAFDVVNEVISDSATPDGLRTSPYYNVLGPSYIDDAFNWAEQAFNVDYAAPGVTRPIALVINDYNTERSDKRARLHALVSDLLNRGIPVDIVGHQFHASLTTPVQSFDEALTAFEDLPVKQVVSELDVMTGTPVDDAKLIEQGYFYRDAFRIFRAHSASVFSVTLWGLYDSRSWRSDNAPLLFDAQLAAKPAYFGSVDQTLPARLRTALVFQANVPLEAGATSALEWQKLRLIDVGDKFSFQLRWEADHLSVFVDAQDATPEAADKLTFQVGENTYTFNRDGTGDVPGVVEEVSGGWKAVVHVPLSDAQQGDQVQFDIALTDGADTLGWNDSGATGTLTLAEPLSYVEVVGIGNGAAPAIDGSIDSVWSLANTVSTDKQTTGTDTAAADVKTLWKGDTLYVLMHVHDDVLDDTASDPWQKDSVEIYVDAGNYKNGAYRPDDTQIRINYKNEVSFGTGDTAAQQARLVSATLVVDDGYIVEASIDLLEEGGAGTFHGLDFQVNDAANGARQGIRNWADPTNAGYLSTSHWGVGRLLEADETVPTLHLRFFIHLTATDADGYHGLTAEVAGVTATDAFDDPSRLTITSDAPEVLPVGRNVVTWTVTDPAGNSSSRKQIIYVHAQVPTSLKYIGSKRVVVNTRSRSNWFTPDAALSARRWACVAGQPVSFTLDRNPVTGEAVPTVLGTDNTNRAGLARLRVSSNQWMAGTYTLTVTYEGNNLGCVGSSTSVTLTVVVRP